jgi:hypothetical protein
MIECRTANRGIALIAVTLAVSACAFERAVVNGGVENLDPSGIVAGRSDRLDVIRQLGAPPEKSVEEAGIRSVGRDYLNYAVFEQRCFQIGFDQVLLITPFRWCFADYPYQLAVEFDENGIVTEVYRTRRDMIWPPFQSEEDQPLPVTSELSGSLLQ